MGCLEKCEEECHRSNVTGGMGCLEKCEEECHRRNGMLKRVGEASERGCLMVGLSKEDVFC